jgi:predicted Zn-dependent protease
MRDPDELLKLCGTVIAESRADQTEVFATETDHSLTRYANNIIHQNVAESDCQATIRCVIGKRIGVASTNRVAPDELKAAAERACKMAELSAENADFVSLPGPEYGSPAAGPPPVEATLRCGPEERAKAVGEVIGVAKAEGCNAAGAYTIDRTAMAVRNSLGICAAGAFADAHLRTLMQGGDSSGFVDVYSPDAAEISGEQAARVAADKCRQSAHPREVPPGDYTVILEELAVAELLEYLGFYTFNALAFQEGRSFMSGKIGEKVCGENITLYDDGLDPRGLPLPFDFEGVPRQKTVLIEKGVAKDVVWDSYTAGRNDPPRKSTGHALPPPATWGPGPMNLFLATGDKTVPEMVAETERGILVTRFHYVNMVHPMRTVMTGMTRDGTFLIEGGEIAGGIKNMRFTQSVIEALGKVTAIGSVGKRVERNCIPVLKTEGFTFSSGTQF